MRNALFFFFLGALGFVITGASSGSGGYECTSISVPESSNYPIRANGKLQAPPSHVSSAFQTISTTVLLPEGYVPVGGDSLRVIACRQLP